jgi:hypothetical protein
VLALAIVAVFGPVDADRGGDRGAHVTPHFAAWRAGATASAPFLEAERILGACSRIVAHHPPNILGPSSRPWTFRSYHRGRVCFAPGLRPPLASCSRRSGRLAVLSDSLVPVVVRVSRRVANSASLFGEALRDAVDPRIRQEF